eukprot:Em0021g208a
MFPAEMKKSNVPHFDILRAPIGDFLFCAKYIAQKCMDTSKLLQQLAQVGTSDPHVAMLLLHQYLHNNLVDPPDSLTPDSVDNSSSPLTQKFLSNKIENGQFRKLFDNSTLIDRAHLLSISSPHASAWLLHPLVQSLCEALNLLQVHGPALGLYVNLSKYFCSSFITTKRMEARALISQLEQVGLVDPRLPWSFFVSVMVFKRPSLPRLFSFPLLLQNNCPPSLMTLSNHLLNLYPLADKARLLSISSTHASAWMSVTPSESFGLHLDPPIFQVATKWWLGLDTSEGSQCALCPGNHSITSAIMQSPASMVEMWSPATTGLGTFWWKACHRAHIGIQVEVGNNLTCDHTALDVSITSPLNPQTQAGVLAKTAAQVTEARKHQANDPKCSELGLTTSTGKPKLVVLNDIYGQLNVHLPQPLPQPPPPKPPPALPPPAPESAPSDINLNHPQVPLPPTNDHEEPCIVAGTSLLHELLVASAPHASSWLTVVPTVELGVHLDPTDVLVRDWAQGKPAVFDIMATSPLSPAILAETSLRDLGHHLHQTTGDSQSYPFLLKRLSVAIQRKFHIRLGNIKFF